MRIAIMGGTFNPIHYAHLRVAEEVREGMGMDKVLFVPTAVTPHKPEEGMTPANARLEMVRLAIADNPGFEVSDVEIKRGGRSFTVDTLKEFYGAPGVELNLIIGNDSFNAITLWREYETLFALANIIVVARPGHIVKKPAEALPVELARKFWYDAQTDGYRNSYDKTLIYAATTLMDISASDIRNRVAALASIRYLTPLSVAEYINREGLYRRPV